MNTQNTVPFQSTSPVRGTTMMALQLLRMCWYFNPRPPCGGRQYFPDMSVDKETIFQSTSPVRGTTRYLFGKFPLSSISIHVPRAGDDPNRYRRRFSSVSISIHVPRAGDDAVIIIFVIKALIFQSTSPVRGTTSIVSFTFLQVCISIHVPRAGDDSKTVQFFRSLQHVLHYFLLIGSSNPILF